MAIRVEPSERTTMSRKHRNAVLEGIVRLNQHDAMLRSSMGLAHASQVTFPKVVVFTSHPALFQDSAMTVYDVGVEAGYLEDGVATTTNFQEMMEGCELVVIAIEYPAHATPLNHKRLLYEVEMYCDATGARFLHVDVTHTERWEHHVTPQIPFITDSGLAFTTNSDDLREAFESWATNKTMDEVLSWDFVIWLQEWSHDVQLDDRLSVAFPATVEEDLEGSEDRPVLDGVFSQEDIILPDQEEMIREEMFVDEIDIPGLPPDETERRRLWKQLPQRVRIGVRRLHRAFGHVPKNTLINLLRAAKVRKEFIDAVKVHRCEICEKTGPKKPTHKTQLPSEYTFNHTLGIDILEVLDSKGEKYQVLNMVDIGTTFQLSEIIKVGAGQPSSKACLDALIKRWFSWAGLPVQVLCDRGLHNRGVLQKYLDEVGVQVKHVALESPESLGRVERHGGLMKAMFRKVCAEINAHCKADVESIFALQHMARIEAQKAFVHLDCSRRVQKALTHNVASFEREYSVGDLVTFRRDNQRGGTRWSPTCRVIGHEGQKNVWLSSGPPAWPHTYNSLDDLPAPLREHFQRAREGAPEANHEAREEAMGLFSSFFSQAMPNYPPAEELGKKVLKSINYDRASPEVQAGLNKSREAEWDKFIRFAAAIPVTGKEKEDLLAAGHVPIPSQWIDTDKNQHKQGTAGYSPKYKSRLVSCGNFEKGAEGLRSDSPTAECELHHLLAAFAASRALTLCSADVTNAYFQAKPLDRILLMRLPRGGLPGVDPEALLLIRVPVYGLSDSGRGFFLQLDEEAKKAGLTPSRIYAAFYYLMVDGVCEAMLTTHVDDILFAASEKGQPAVDRLLQKFDLGAQDKKSFRYCGKQFSEVEDTDGTTAITIDVIDNTRRISGIQFEATRLGTDPLEASEVTTLRSVVGSLAWIARQAQTLRVFPLSFSSTTIKRVCRSTLQAETYSLQSGLEIGDKLRGLLGEVQGHIVDLKRWEEQSREQIPHLALTDCRSLSDHLDAEVPAKVTDKRLGIELSAIHENLWKDGRRTFRSMRGGDQVRWTSTSTMVADALTKLMRPDLLVKTLLSNLVRVEGIETHRTKKKR
eukprot:Skav206186  [mRNA]  locus=scaffold1844:100592:105303:- [translate_table: standard]